MTSFFSIGVNHNSAPVQLREQVAFTPDKLINALQQYASTHRDDELVILSTCNRTEVYLASESKSQDHMIQWLSDVHGIDRETLAEHLYQHHQNASVDHLMKVASGLDSLILGEPQILGQVKQAYNEAKRAGTVGPYFEKLFQTTFSVAKQVRTETDIGANAVSVAFAAVQLTRQVFSSIDKSTILLVGAGETIELVARHLKDANAKNIMVANRTLENAKKLATQIDATALTISQIPEHLAEADVVISSTASALPLIGTGMVGTALKKRKHKPMLLVDLAVPRDIEEEVSQLDEAYLYTVDDLQDIIEQNLASREQAAMQAEQIIQQKVVDFEHWLATLDHVDVIKEYRRQSSEVSNELSQRAIQQISQGESAEAVIEQLTKKLSNQLLHGPTKLIQHAIKSNDEEWLHAIKSELLSEPKNLKDD